MEGTVQEMVAVVSVTSVDLRLTDIGAAGPEVEFKEDDLESGK